MTISVRAALAAGALCALAGCATAPAASQQAVAVAPIPGVSDAAAATAVRDSAGAHVGYDTPSDALKAGDMAAFVQLVQDRIGREDGPGDFGHVVVAVDRAAAGDTEAARAELAKAEGDVAVEATIAYTQALLSALDGKESEAIDEMRLIGGALPGLTGDLALAALLEAFERHDEALAVYESLTPRVIVAPDHDFDPQGILFAHTQTVVSRRTLLLRKLGRIDEAKAVYAALADAEPEQATRYAAAIEALETGRGIDDDFLTPKTAFARAYTDLSLALYQRRIIQAAMLGARLTGFDENRVAMDQLALLMDPENEDLRSIVIDGLYEEAFYDGAAHVAEAAPEPTARLQLSAASAYLLGEKPGAARDALDRASALTTSDERLETLSGMLRIYTLLGEERRAVSVAEDARQASINDSERAVANALTAATLQYFGRADEAVDFARTARDLDDTHDRRMALADVLGAAGDVEEGLRLIRTERLSRPNDPYMLNTLGYYLITRTDRIEEGYKTLVRAYALADRDPYIADSLGWA
ncbi:MAG: hypothetical protein AAFS03_04940, partial [Pseudomonadota bacterium]